MLTACAMLVAALAAVPAASMAGAPGTGTDDASAANGRSSQSANTLLCNLFGCVAGDAKGLAGNRLVAAPPACAALAALASGSGGQTRQQIMAALDVRADEGGPAALWAGLRDAMRPSVVTIPGAIPHGSTTPGPARKLPAFEMDVRATLQAGRADVVKPAFVATAADAYGVEVLSPGPSGESPRTGTGVPSATARAAAAAPGGGGGAGSLLMTVSFSFRSPWETPFPKHATREGGFTLAQGRIVKVPLMSMTDTFAYARIGDVQVVAVPYFGNDAMLLVALPDRADGLGDFARSLTPGKVAAWMAAMRPTRIALTLPRFDVAATLDIGPALRMMGVTAAFDASEADFPGIVEKPGVPLGTVMQFARLAVDEDGSGAALPDVIRTEEAFAARPARATAFVANHPFLFLVRHNAAGAILCAGILADPTAATPRR